MLTFQRLPPVTSTYQHLPPTFRALDKTGAERPSRRAKSPIEYPKAGTPVKGGG